MRSATVIFMSTILLARQSSAFICTGGLSLVSWGIGAIASNGNKESCPVETGRKNTVKRNFWNSIFAGGSDGIDYLQLTGMAAKEAAALALDGKVTDKSKDGYTIATFAGGCFWGTELQFQRQIGVIDTAVGYTQGKEDKPTYEFVCSGTSGHTECVQVFYDPKQVTYEALCNLFFSRIDPTLSNQVGNDRGTQYRHGIYYHNEEQGKIAKEVITKLQANYKRPIVTECKPATIFWPAEEYHQKYLSHKGGRGGRPQSAAKGCTDTIRCYG